MIDLHAHFKRERKAVGYDDLMRVLEADRVAVEKGDMVCLYTGFADVILELKKNPDAKLCTAPAVGSTDATTGCSNGSPTRASPA